ncbi:MAG: UDP-N-acetylmuramate--L-alanine ligase [Legionellales bacterium RIFCSPHIGHO2_12_FULL_37_14]|nr:MAG: UDP-N-acetylmuramate--L-alanine ligase [Legionellales bacterium RIFCSPHIGHO2_12_FULL_37_14]
MGKVKHIHFVGIGGAGMCGIAEVLHEEGYVITGSDLSETKTIHRLRDLGIHVFIGHASANITNADVLVQSSAISADNEELVAARKLMIPIIPRAAMLAELMRFRFGIAIAGTHGKTTTTSLISHVLIEAGYDPTYVIGGKLNCSGQHAQLGKSPYLVAEADESDASFLFLKPMMAVVTNIDKDHMSTYANSFTKLKQTFVEFLHHLPFYGLAALCIDCPQVRKLFTQIERPKASYGFSRDAAYRAYNWQQQELVSTFTVTRPAPYKELTLTLPVPGKHNVLNALATIAIATELGLNDAVITNSLANFQGVGRRFQLLGEVAFPKGKALVIDDYGHHPNEIKATIEAFRAIWPNKKLVHVFQPHRYTRTRDLFDDFVNVLSLSDELLLLDIYPAGESPIAGITSETLLKKIQQKSEHAHSTTQENLHSTVASVVTDGCAVLMQGAGNISQLAQALVKVK